MNRFVNGFMFSHDMNTVALIRKNRPDWQRGKLNGIGGRIEPGETPHQAMVREFREESGVVTVEADWINFAILQGPATGLQYEAEPWEANMFYSIGDPTRCQTQTDEEIEFHSIGCLLGTVDNTPWLVRMALAHKDQTEQRGCNLLRVQYCRDADPHDEPLDIFDALELVISNRIFHPRFDKLITVASRILKWSDKVKGDAGGNGRGILGDETEDDLRAALEELTACT